jgi:hypothetical protein
MPDPLVELEQQRFAVLRQVSELEDFRAGSITGTGGRCGNPGCHCHCPGDPGHLPEVVEKIRTEAEYFGKNADRMRYPKFRRQHLFVASGVIEAGCKTVIGSRLKQSGMFWTLRRGNAILALRCCHLNGRFEDYWEARRAA